ncbi:MAG: hypothetical protein Q9207_005716 [Kuettlingeria erythrocarpa]
MLICLPTEILSCILEYVVAGNVPLDLSKLVNNVTPDASRNRPEFPDFTDWIIASSISKRLRPLGKRAYFTKKPFIVSPKFLNQLIQIQSEAPAPESTEADNVELFFKHAQYIIAPMQGYSAASEFLTLPRYQTSLTKLRVLTLWPELRSPAVCHPIPDYRTLAPEPATEELRGLLQGIGLDISRLRIDVAYSRNHSIRGYNVDHLRAAIFPYLRFVGRQRAQRMSGR